MTPPLRVAIIGAGIGAEHLAAYRQLPDLFEVRVLCDLDAARARAVIGKDQIRIETDLATVTAAHDIDLIDICLPPHLHVPTLLDAMQAGKAAICEKPIACSLADVDRLIATAKALKAQVFPVFQYRYGTAIAQMRALLQSGVAGRVYSASFETHWNRDAQYYGVPWRGTWAGEQGGAVLGHAIHAHDLMVYLLGPVTQVSAQIATRVNGIETEDCGAISFALDSGALVSSSLTLGAATDTSRIKVMCENLTAESGLSPYAPGSQTWHFTARGAQDQGEIDDIVAKVAPVDTGFTGFLKAVGQNLTTGQGERVTLEQARASIEIVTAIYHAARSGTMVRLPLDKDAPLYQGWRP